MESIIRYEKPYSDYKRTERQEMLIAAPLDLSFKRATTMNENWQINVHNQYERVKFHCEHLQIVS